jgi:DNA-binding SARP family transcriptional activator
LDGQAIDLPGRRERALLAYLAMSPGEPRSREKLAGMLWSERADKQARDSLKQAVLKLRKALNGVQPTPLPSDREFVTLDPAAVSVDVAEFERLIGHGTPEAVARATALYRGDLLDGFEAYDRAFEEWLLMERQRLRDLAREALAGLLDRHITAGRHERAPPRRAACSCLIRCGRRTAPSCGSTQRRARLRSR